MPCRTVLSSAQVEGLAGAGRCQFQSGATSDAQTLPSKAEELLSAMGAKRLFDDVERLLGES